MKHKKFGFTLIELMITVAIVGIIAAIAFPSYMSSVRKTNRAEAKTELVDVAQRLQRCYTAYARFDDPNNQNRCAVYEQLENGEITTRGSGYYEITLDGAATAATYKLKATAVKSPQTADTADGCNVLTLDHKGEQLPDECW